MEIRFETIPSYKIVYIRKYGPYGDGNIQTMENLKNRARCNHLLDDTSVILGIAQDNPQTTKPENCRYDACLVVTDDSGIQDDSFSHGTVAGGRYAVFTIDHTPEAVRMAWMEIFLELQRQGHRIDAAKPVMERYAARMLKDHKCEICVPVT